MAPVMEPYSRHIIICTGGFCSPQHAGRALYAALPVLLENEGLLFGPNRVKRSEVPCLGVCSEGPIVVVYPEGVWYAAVDLALLQRIVQQHLKRGETIEDRVWFRL